MGEIYETSLTADHWSDPEGNRLPIGELDDRGGRGPRSGGDHRQGEPEEDFEGYTGNAGMTAGSLVSPCRDLPLAREAGISRSSASRDSRAVVPELTRMVAGRWQKARGEGRRPSRRRCRELAAAIVAKWPEQSHAQGWA